MPKCLPEDIKKYVAQHLRDDAEHHRSMTTQQFRSSHGVMWKYIDFEKWKQIMYAQADYSEKAAELIESIHTCKE